MKKLIFILVVFVIVSCKDEKQDTTTTAENTETELTEMEKKS